jgi:CubicO group peptidase (beta-lactamase class C family)
MKNIQKKIQEKLDESVNEGKERGIQIAVYFQGELVVDAWAGIADAAKDKPVEGDTMFPVFSTTKGIAATVIHILAEQGKLNYDAKIADYWPEFGVNGKENITLRQALTHTAGVPNMPVGMGPKDFMNWDKMCTEMTKLKPVFEPGTKMEYHAITYGWLVGEVARRVDGRSFSKIMEDEICRPLRIKDMYVGIPEKLESRIAILEDPSFNKDTLNIVEPQPIPAWMCPLYVWMNRAEGRRSCGPASNGIMSARAVARHYASLIPGGVDGIELLPPKRMKTATERQKLKDDTYIGKTLGYILGDKGSIMGDRYTVFGHGGHGGSVGFADPEYKLAIGLTKNLFSNSSVNHSIACEVRKLLNIP